MKQLTMRYVLQKGVLSIYIPLIKMSFKYEIHGRGQNRQKHAYLTCQYTSLQLTDLSKLSKRSVIAWTASVEAVPKNGIHLP